MKRVCRHNYHELAPIQINHTKKLLSAHNEYALKKIPEDQN